MLRKAVQVAKKFPFTSLDSRFSRDFLFEKVSAYLVFFVDIKLTYRVLKSIGRLLFFYKKILSLYFFLKYENKGKSSGTI
jgi:hypothetical protein